MYSDAQRELYNRDVYETDHGFLVYKACEDSSVYLHLMYIDKKVRDNGIASQMIDEVVELTKATVLVSYVDLTTSNPELSVKAHLGYGFSIIAADATSITFKKEVTHGS